MSSSDSDTEFFDACEEINSPKPRDREVFEQLLEQASDVKDKNEHGEPANTPNGELKVDNDQPEESEQDAAPEVAEKETALSQPLPVNGDVSETERLASGEDVPDSAISVQVLEAVETDIVKSACAADMSDGDAKLARQPDLLACVQERPTDLPGVTPVLIVEPEIEDTEEKSETASKDDKNTVVQEEVLLNHADERVQETDTAVFKVPQPPEPVKNDSTLPKKKVPPPRPAPPRPPPPKRNLQPRPARPGKPYLSVVDDGLLTPNSTVDNLTREFTEALNQETAVDNSKRTSPLAKKDVQQNRVPDHEDADNQAAESVDTHSSKSNSLGRQDADDQSAKSNSLGRQDAEILSSVIVRNLDTGESMPLSAAAEQVSQCLNPLALQIMSRTKEFSYAASSSSTNSNETQVNPQPAISQANYADSDSFSVASDEIDIGKDARTDKRRDGSSKVKKAKKLKRIMGKGVSRVKVVAGSKVEKAVQKVKHVKEEVMHTETLNVSSDEDSTDFGSSVIKVKAASSNKGPYQFSHVKQVQDIAVHVGAVWSMKFSRCGRLLATAGQDNVIWVWVLKDYYTYFNDMRNKYDSQDEFMDASLRHTNGNFYSSSDNVFEYAGSTRRGSEEEEDDAPFRQVPFSSYVGHSADVLDLAWSKNFFILSSSMDKTVRLWHISRKECLCCFQHIDFVTAIAFHPRDDRYFLSGSLDSKLRLWNIPDKKVALWNEVSPDGSSSAATGGAGALITTVNFCENGKFAVCGTYDGRCIFFDTEHLKYHTQIHVRSSRGRNTKGHKITGIEPLNGEHKILVTSNDSRVRLYDLRDLSLVCKYKGHTNMSSQIKASFSPGSKHIICGSEDKSIYIWKTSLPQDVTKLSSFRRDRNDCWESLKAHDAVVTCAVFAPQPHLLYQTNCAASEVKSRPKSTSILSLSSRKQSVDEANVIISADFNGAIKVIVSAE